MGIGISSRQSNTKSPSIRRARSPLNGRRLGVLGIASAALLVPFAGSAVATAKSTSLASVIVQEHPGAGTAPERAVVRLGGTVERQLAIINGFSAKLPSSAVVRLRGSRGVKAVTVNSRLRAMSLLPGTSFNQTTAATSLYTAIRRMDVDDFWKAGYTGKGVDVAIIDTGVTRVPGLDAPGKVINGPDISFESQDPARAYNDNFGHGTHLAGLIAGNDTPGASGKNLAGNKTAFLGVAPDARLVNLKVGDGNGVADVSQVIAAVDWIVQHRNVDGLNIRILELAYGTDSKNGYEIDPLVFALEQAWNHGIFVVVSGGNGGKHANGPGLASPATSPTLFTVGAANPGTSIWDTDDSVASFSSTRGSSKRGPDVVAYGVSLPSLRAPGSKSDTLFAATGAIGPRFIKGSGSSQASAVAAGAAAVLLQQRPTLSPDALKAMLKANTTWLPGEKAEDQGAGRIDLDPTPENGWGVVENHPRSNGQGSIDHSRGTRRPTLDGVEIAGDVDIFGALFDPATWAPLSAQGRTWSAGDWNGRTWSGRTWSGESWSGRTWSGRTWSGRTWSSSSWNSSAWQGSNFLGSTWSTVAWN